MTEHDIGAAIFITILIFLALALAWGMWMGNRATFRAWLRWRRSRPNYARYGGDEIKFRADLAVWRMHRP